MIIKILTVSSIILFASCEPRSQISNLSENNPSDKIQLSFNEFEAKIPLIDLPLQTTCKEELEGLKLDINDSLIATFGPEDSKIFGKLADKEKYTAIIYLYPADNILPIIQTTDKQGNKISNLSLFENYCGEDEDFSGTTWTVINKDLTIERIDSITTFRRNKDGIIIDKTRKTEVQHSLFCINDDGQILEQKKKNAQ